MRRATVGLAALIAGYTLSQFYRSFMAVLAPQLQAEIGAGPGDLAFASGLWFAAFAALQMPIGMALDRIGPARVSAALLGVAGGAGAIWFSLATSSADIAGAMTLLGIGCAPVLMAAYYILARDWPQAAFGAMAGMIVGLGSLGDLLGAAPLVRLVEAVGWRGALRGLAVVTVAVAALILWLVPSPPRRTGTEPRGSLAGLLEVRPLRPLLPIIFASYACVVAVRGVWVAPLMATMHAGDDRLIGRATLAMGLSLIVGNLAAGRIQRLFGGPRRAALWLTTLCIAALAVLAIWPDGNIVLTFAALSMLGLTGGNYALMMAHGRSFLPPQLIGLGITFLNTFSLAGVAVLQFGSRPIYQSVLATYGPKAAMSAVFAFFLVPIVIGLVVYAFSQEPAENAG